MIEPVTTGSGIERTVACRASAVLPRVYRASSRWAARGTEVHAYLERIANGATPADSLLLVAEEHRPACEAIDLDAIRPELRLSAEVALAYNPVTDTARVLGQSIERDYRSITEDEWPLTVDLAGLAPDGVVVGDWKTGWAKLARTGSNWQMKGGSLALARAFDRDHADAQLIYLRDGKMAWRDRAGFDAFELAGIAAELRETHERVRADRLAFAAGRHVEPTEGSWCRYCPSYWSCPAKVALVRWALTGEGSSQTGPADVVVALERVRAGKKALELVEKQLLAAAEADPMLVEVGEDGAETWLGLHPKPGNEKLDPSITIDVAMDVLGVPAEKRAAFTDEITGITKKALEAAVKKRTARGGAASTLESILAAVRARGGATRPTADVVGLYQINRRPALAAGGK